MLGTVEAPPGAISGGRTPLAPRRDIRLIVCLSPQERAAIVEQARAAGYESVAAFIRARALAPQQDNL